MWRSRGAWHGGTVRVEPIKASTDAAAEKIRDASEGVPAEKKRGDGEGVRVWFWLPGAAQSAGAAGTRLAGVDVGSVEASTAAAANDAAVAGGTVPRIELVYQKGVDASDGRIVARALVPGERTADPRNEASKAETPPACDVESLPFDMSSVDVREVLADGMRAASVRRLRRVLAAIEGPLRRRRARGDARAGGDAARLRGRRRRPDPRRDGSGRGREGRVSAPGHRRQAHRERHRRAGFV